MAAVAVVDTACDGYYRWAANGRYYTQSDSITIALTVTEGCDSLMPLYLTISPALSIEMKSENYKCYESTNAYAEATVTGGFEQGYLYSWTKDGVEVSATNRIDLATCGEQFGPGTYQLTVIDSMHQSCSKNAEVTITRPESLQIAVDYSDGMCYNQNDGYAAIDVKGGTIPYVISWGGGSMDVSEAKKDTITGLAAGTYTITVTDANGCVVDTAGVDLTEDDTEYSVTAFAVNKMYDGLSVNPARYILKIGDGATDTLASDSCMVLANGDTLRAHVSVTDTAIKDVTTLSNDITCRFNVTLHNSNVIISKRDVILTSASAQKEYDEQPLTAPTVTVSGSGFVGDEGVESYTVTGSQTEAGASLNYFTYALKENTNPDNYQISKVEGALVVGPKGFLTVIANSNAKVYDGTPLTDPGYTFVFPTDSIGTVLGEDDTVIATVSGDGFAEGELASCTATGTITNVGETDNTVVIVTTGNFKPSNYDIDTTLGKLKVTKRPLNIVGDSRSIAYDGQSHKYQDYTVLYNNTSVSYTSPMHYTLPTGDELVITPKDKGETDVRHVTESSPNAFSITLANESFYSSITLDTGRINITPREVELRSNGEWSLYTGLAIPTVKNDTCVQRTGYGFPTGEGVTCTITGSQVEVGTSPNTFTYTFNSGTQESDYNISIYNGTLTVVKAPLKIVAVDTNKYYGEENPEFTYRFEGFVHGEDTLNNAPFLPASTRPVLTTTAELNSPSGQYPINVDVTGVEFKNYMVEPQDGILTIRRRPF